MDAFLNIFCIWIGCMISIILTLGLMEGLGRPATRTSPNGVTTTRYSPLHLILFVFLFLFAFIELKFRFQDPLGLHPVRALPPVRLLSLIHISPSSTKATRLTHIKLGMGSFFARRHTRRMITQSSSTSSKTKESSRKEA